MITSRSLRRRQPNWPNVGCMQSFSCINYWLPIAVLLTSFPRDSADIFILRSQWEMNVFNHRRQTQRPIQGGVVTALKLVRAEQVRRPFPSPRLWSPGLLPRENFEILNATSCDLVHILCCKCKYSESTIILPHGIATASCLSLSMSVRPYLCDVEVFWSNIRWNTSKISRMNILQT